MINECILFFFYTRTSFCLVGPIASTFVWEANPVKVVMDTVLEVTDTGRKGWKSDNYQAVQAEFIAVDRVQTLSGHLT